MRKVFNTGCGLLTEIEVNGTVALLQKDVNGEYVVVYGYNVTPTLRCEWAQGHYFGSKITPAVIEFSNLRIKTQTLGKFISRSINSEKTYSVYNDITDEEFASYYQTQLTDEGKEHFAELLELPIEEYNNSIVVLLANRYDENEKLEKLEIFFSAMAGNVSSSKYDKWFR